MPTVEQQKNRIDDIQTAQYITGALRDISAIEMRDYRKQFETNAGFYDELKGLYTLIQHIATEEGRGVAAERQRADTLFVAYTTNKHFYGSINNDIMTEFKKRTGNADRCLIIGETGKQVWQSSARKRREVSFLSFADDMPNEEETRTFLAKTSRFGKVFVFYPGFQSAFTQRPEMIDITFSEGVQKKPQKGEQGQMVQDVPEYILEPEILEMFSFFDTQVRYVLFERLLLETQLSRVAARLLKMDTADQSAQRMLRDEFRELRRVQSSVASTRMLETISGFIQWHKKEQPIAL
jgi:F-type H+-transporting ATPase subunit gamma